MNGQASHTENNNSKGELINLSKKCFKSVVKFPIL